MSYDRKYKKGEEVEVSHSAKETVKDIQSFPFMDFPERGIRKSTMERFGVRVGLSPENGKEIQFVYFPSFNQKGKVVGYMRQDLTKSKEEKGHWQAIGSVTIGNKLFGQDVSETIERKRNNIVVTEGQWDCLSVYQALVDNVAGTKYAGMEPFVVSIPLGTKNAVEAIMHNHEFVKKHDALTIFFDNDECTQGDLAKGIMKGAEARHAVAGALLGNGQSLFVVTPPAYAKDASDMLQAGESSELAKLVQFEKRPYSPEKVVQAGSVVFEDFIAERERGVVVDCFPSLMEKLNGFRLKELTMLLAPSGVGKTSCCSILAHRFMKAGHKVGLVFLEESPKDTLQRIVAADLKVNYTKFRRNPLSVASKESVMDSYNDIVKNNRLSMLDHFGSIPVDDLLNKIKHMVLIDGCEYIILDHISGVVASLETDNERKSLDVAMSNLAAFCSAHNVHLVVICHINRTDSAQFLPPKGKEGEPFWVNVRKESARGSAALEQFSWNILGLEPEINPDFSRGRVRWKVLKTRFGDSLGIADTFSLHPDTWEVILSDNDVGF